jgi:putative ABC transport system substrate-binding protein
MRRREFIGLLGAGFLAPIAAGAQQIGRTYRLGALLPLTQHAPVNVAFLDELRRGGFIEGQNLSVEWRAYGEHFDQVSLYATELVKARVDVITTAGDNAIRPLQQATKTIPIVAITDDMLASGFVNSVARPDGNITGVNIRGDQSNGKRQDILIEAVPGIRRMAVLADESLRPIDELQEAARFRNIELSEYRVATGEEIAPAIERAQASGATALNVLVSTLFYAYRQLIRDRAAALHLPAIFPWPEEAEEGAFAAYGPAMNTLSFVEVMSQQIMKLFRGAKVAEIPIEQPTKFELVINLKTANAMGVTVPAALLLRADKLIE